MIGAITELWIWALMWDSLVLDIRQTAFARIVDVHAVVKEVFFAYLEPKSCWFKRTTFAAAVDVEVD